VLLMMKCCPQPEAQSSNFRSKILEAVSARLHRRLIAASFQFFAWIDEFGGPDRAIKNGLSTWPCAVASYFVPKSRTGKARDASDEIIEAATPSLSSLPIELTYNKR